MARVRSHPTYFAFLLIEEVYIYYNIAIRIDIIKNPYVLKSVMAYGVQDTGGSFAQTKYMLILEAVRNMGKKYVECKGAEDIEATNELYRSVEYGLQLVESALPIEVQQALELDRKKLNDIEAQMDNSQAHKDSIKNSKSKIRYSYAINKMYYVHAGSNELDIYKQTKDGELDFSFMDLNVMTQILKDSTHNGMTVGLSQAISKKEGAP